MSNLVKIERLYPKCAGKELLSGIFCKRNVDGTRKRVNMNRNYLNGNDWKIKEFIGMDWVWRDSVMPETKDLRWWYPAKVPGSVLYDMWQAGKVPDPFFELNSKLSEWVPARTWVYRKEFETPKGWDGEHVELCFEGIDYEAEIFVNGSSLGCHRGMYTSCRFDVTGKLVKAGKNLLAVVLQPAPFEQPQVGKTSLVHTHKSRMTYWWDFCPRMIHQGIWQDVYLECTGEIRFDNVYIYADFIEKERTAEVHMELQIKGKGSGEGCLLEGCFGEYSFETRIEEGRGDVVLRIPSPKLWWTNGAGEPFQYEVRLRLLDQKGQISDSRNFLYGIRDIRFLQNDGCRKAEGQFTLCLNGRRIYIKGYNWVPADVMYGTVQEEKLRHLIRLAKEAGVNMFRVWGGGLIETDLFYELCAQSGILVWQEFIQSSSGIENKTPEDEEYGAMMEKEAEIIIKAKRNHTALAVWCGGNELQDGEGMPLDGKDALLARLEKQVRKWDSRRKWLPTSPSGGLFLNSMDNIRRAPEKLFDVHGPWEHQGLEKHCLLYNSGTSFMASEFGVEGMANESVLNRCVAREHWIPANKDNEIYFHRGAWWNNEPLVQETMGGRLTKVEQIRKASQFMQYEGLKYAVESNIRRAMKNSASFPWQFNEPYPNLFCTSAVDYYGCPKPAYYGVRKAYGVYRVTAAFASPSVAGEEKFRTEIFAGRDSANLRKDEMLCIRALLLDMQGNAVIKEEAYISDMPEISGKVMDLTCHPAEIRTPIFLLRLSLSAGVECLAENEYLFTKEKNFAPVWDMKEAKVSFSWRNERELVMENTGDTAALFVYLKHEGDDTRLYFSENYISLMPGENRSIGCEGNLNGISAEALNMMTRALE